MTRTRPGRAIALTLLVFAGLAPVASAQNADLSSLVREASVAPQPVLTLLTRLHELQDGTWTPAHIDYALQATQPAPAVRAALEGRSIVKAGAQLELRGPGAVTLLASTPLNLEARVRWTAGPAGPTGIAGLSAGHPPVAVTSLRRQGSQVQINPGAGGPSADDLRRAGVADAVLRARQRAIVQRTGGAVWLTSGSSKPLGKDRSTEGHEVWRADGVFYLSGVRQAGYGILLQTDASGRVVSTLFDPNGAGSRAGFDAVLPRSAMRARVQQAGARELSSGALTAARTIKSAAEVALLERACDVTAEALNRAMRAIPRATSERTIADLIERTFLEGGCQGPGFKSIVASGANALTLHYNRNSASYGKGVLIKMDVGGELGGYSSDITRTVPTDGTFSAEQRALYSLVLEANERSIAAVRPGVTLNQLEAISKRIIGQQGHSIPHKVSHWVGLSVHDVGPSRSTPLRPGMVFTIEPGVYLRAGTRVRVDGRTVRLRQSTGIRIEDVILVTATGCRVLSSKTPKSIAAIEALMRGKTPIRSPTTTTPTPSFKRRRGIVDRLKTD